MDINALKINKNKSEDGIWFLVENDFYLRVGRTGTKKYESLAVKLRNKNKQAFDSGNATPEQSRKVIAKLLSETVIFDWKGLKDAGKEISFDKDLCYKILVSEDTSWIADRVIEFASDLTNYRNDEIEEEAKKS